MDDLLRRIKADLPLLKKWLLDARIEPQEGERTFFAKQGAGKGPPEAEGATHA